MKIMHHDDIDISQYINLNIYIYIMITLMSM